MAKSAKEIRASIERKRAEAEAKYKAQLAALDEEEKSLRTAAKQEAAARKAKLMEFVKLAGSPKAPIWAISAAAQVIMAMEKHQAQESAKRAKAPANPKENEGSLEANGG